MMQKFIHVPKYDISARTLPENLSQVELKIHFFGGSKTFNLSIFSISII
jgi:hypothetical protein